MRQTVEQKIISSRNHLENGRSLSAIAALSDIDIRDMSVKDMYEIFNAKSAAHGSMAKKFVEYSDIMKNDENMKTLGIARASYHDTMSAINRKAGADLMNSWK